MDGRALTLILLMHVLIAAQLYWGSNPAEPPALVAGALTTELRCPHSHLSNSTPALRVIDNPIPKLVLEESARIIKINHHTQNTNTSSNMIVQGLAA